jgi:Zn-finger domain-containing protein
MNIFYVTIYEIDIIVSRRLDLIYLMLQYNIQMNMTVYILCARFSVYAGLPTQLQQTKEICNLTPQMKDAEHLELNALSITFKRTAYELFQ